MLNIFPFGKKHEENNNTEVVTETPVEETPTQDVYPVTPTPTETSVEAAPVENNDPNRKKVLLVVDDNKLNLKVASKLLGDFDCDIETVQSGKECIEKVQQDNKYDLIFMDIMMPDMDGVQTMHTLKSMPDFHVPVVSLTADAVEGSREKYLCEGFDDYIPKPMDREEMHDAINKYIGN